MRTVNRVFGSDLHFDCHQVVIFSFYLVILIASILTFVIVGYCLALLSIKEELRLPFDKFRMERIWAMGETCVINIRSH